MQSPTELVHYVACSLVRKPEQVQVRTIPGNKETIIELRVDEDDISRVIGKRGNVARSLRALLQFSSKLEKKNYVLEIVE